MSTFLKKAAATAALTASLFGVTAGVTAATASARPDDGNGCAAKWRIYEANREMFHLTLATPNFSVNEANFWLDASAAAHRAIVRAKC